MKTGKLWSFIMVVIDLTAVKTVNFYFSIVDPGNLVQIYLKLFPSSL